MEIEAGPIVRDILQMGVCNLMKRMTVWPGCGKGVVCQVVENRPFTPIGDPGKGIIWYDYCWISLVEEANREKGSRDIQV